MNDKKTSIADLKQLVQNFVEERNWNHHHTPKNLSMSIAIEAGELMEHFQWRSSDEADLKIDRNEVENEIADVAAYLLSLCNVLDIDLSQAMTRKMELNAKKYPKGQPGVFDDQTRY